MTRSYAERLVRQKASRRCASCGELVSLMPGWRACARCLAGEVDPFWSEETIRDPLDWARRGLWIGGPPPYGYTTHKRRLAPRTGEAEVVRELFQRYLTWPVLNQCNQWLERQAKPRRGRSFGKHAAARILRNAIYAGQVSLGGCVFPHRAPLVTRALFDQVNSLLNERAKGGADEALSD